MFNNKKGFTLAEVLITLSIIGVIAAILFPSILANYNERTLKAKRQALVARMSQAMGNMADTFRNYESVKTREKKASDKTDPNCSTNPMDCVDDGSALKFINEGLSKVYKIAAVCDNETLSACDIPDEITRADGTTFSIKEHAKSFFDYNPQVSAYSETTPFDTNSAGVMTKNGESLLIFYNPSCSGRITYTTNAVFTDLMMCVNIIYDLNGGKKKPNRMGEDIGFMTVLYNDTPFVAAPRLYDVNAVPYYDITENSLGQEIPINFKSFNFNQSKAACAALGDNVGLPSVEEGRAMQMNRELWRPAASFYTRHDSGLDPSNTADNNGYSLFWTSTMASPTEAWQIELINSRRAAASSGNHRSYTYLRSINTAPENNFVQCVYKD